MASLARKISIQSNNPFHFLPSLSSLTHRLPGRNHSNIFNPVTRIPLKDDDRLRQQMNTSSNLLRIRISSPTSSKIDLRCYCVSFFGTKNSRREPVDPEVEAKQLSHEERDRTIQTIRDGAQLLLGGSDLAQGQSLLFLQVVVKVRHGLLVRNFGSATCIGSGSPLDQIQEVARILMEYPTTWIQSCSIVLDKVDDLHNRVCASNFQGRVKANDNQLKLYSKVTLFALANSEISDDKVINKCKQLEEFLRSLVQPCQKIQNVHVTYSSVISVPKKELQKCHLRLTGS